ncbi:MAG: PH domain-containing protein [Gordonia sp. (in: high G+C Gram-positive bacteria)]|uniref:PH domain-containing protein n=1 Tax=Gordonia sp. (in: high G+C Gram-positive bacteria) TaxID=84139 RepID=UPI0039E4864B
MSDSAASDSSAPDSVVSDSGSGPDRPTVAFTISRLAYLTVLSTVLAVLVMMAVSPWFGILFLTLIPQIWWIRRVRTEVDAAGITAVHSFGETRIPWDDVDGLGFPRWSAVRAVRKDGSLVRLPAVSFDDLPVLAEVSGGRVPDPFAAEYEARLAAQD